MKKNKNGCYQICDFCKHYHFNGLDAHGKTQDGKIFIEPRAVYVNEGYCGLDLKQRDPQDGCDRFKEKPVSILSEVRWWIYKIKLFFGLYKFKDI